MKKWGKEIQIATFLNPVTGKEEEFLLFAQPNWATILPVTKDNMVIAVRQFYQGANKITLELPAGTVDFEELPQETARRELQEETGYVAEELIVLGAPLFITSRNSWTQAFLFLALGCKKVDDGKQDPSEPIEIELIPLTRWLEMARTTTEDLASVAATFRALPHLDLNS